MILITGGAGYVGSHINLALTEAGHATVVVDDLSTGYEWALRWGRAERLDIRDRRALASLCRKHGVTAIVHCAANIAVGESVREPALYYENNVGGALALFGAAMDAGVKNLIFSSTAAVYGDPQYVPLDEHHPLAPVSPYGRTKLTVESMLADYAAAGAFNYVSLRYFNACGAHASGLIGEAHEPETHLIPLALDVAWGRTQVITVFGNDYNTVDGTCVRDYIHVDDIAAAHVSALRFLEGARAPLIANLGSGQGLTVLEVIEACRRVTGHSIPISWGKRRPGDPERLVASSDLAQRQLDWVPRRSQIENIVESAWKWHRSYRASMENRR